MVTVVFGNVYEVHLHGKAQGVVETFSEGRQGTKIPACTKQAVHHQIALHSSKQTVADHNLPTEHGTSLGRVDDVASLNST